MKIHYKCYKTENRVFRYRISNTNHNSHKYGHCQVCGKYCGETFIQHEEEAFIDHGELLWSTEGCQMPLGHHHCLLQQRHGKLFHATPMQNVIFRELEARDIEWRVLAQKLREIMSWNEAENLICNQRHKLTTASAAILADFFGTSAEFWMNLDRNFRNKIKNVISGGNNEKMD